MPKIEWKAIYKDGNTLSQYNEGRENKYTDIDKDSLCQFIILENNIPKVIISLNDNKKLIYRQRVATSFTGENVSKTEKVYIVGWQDRVQGINTQMICFLFEDGHIEITDRFDKKHPWFYPIVFLPEEESRDLDYMNRGEN